MSRRASITLQAEEAETGKDSACAEPACAVKADAFRRLILQKKPSKQTDSNKYAIAATSVETEVEGGTLVELSRSCPADREELGRAGWTLLHTTAAYYPENPNQAQKEAAINLVRSLATLYPCGYCRDAFAEDLEKSPPMVETREDFSVWLCKQHNRVNESLGKPSFECTLAALQRRWRSGDQRCQELYVQDKSLDH